ncbi:MAG: SDR family oxidoreductase [Lautropia sp.]
MPPPAPDGAADAIRRTAREPAPGPAPARVALVTGAARRIGRAIALALAADGWDIGVHYGRSSGEAEDTAAGIRRMGRRATCLQADLAVEAEAARLLPALEAALGPVSAVVNNASRFEQDEVASFGYATLAAHIGPNLAAPLLLARMLGEAATAGGRDGVVVNLLDQKLFNPNPDFLSYTMSKAALHAATTLLAQALAPRIRVVGVAPGLTLPSYLQDEDRFADAHRRYSPLGRSSTPDDVASAVVFAMSNPAMTGTVMLVDGGQHLMPLARDVSLMPAMPGAGAAR